MRARPSKFALILSLVLIAVGPTRDAQASVVTNLPYGSLEHASRARYEVPAIERMAALEKILMGKINHSCRKARVSRLDFDRIRDYDSYLDYCGVPDAELPAEVIALLGKIESLNTKIAAVLGQTLDATFSEDIGLTLSADFRGSIGSEAYGGGVFLTVLPDWTIADFAPMIYAHEVIHALAYNGGATASALRGLVDHPLLSEALPDLISAEVHQSPKLLLGESGLPDCLKTIRDASPVTGFGEAFSRFYTLGTLDGILQCCASVDVKKYSSLAQSICESSVDLKPTKLSETETFVRNKGIVTTPYTPATLAAPFEAEACKITTKTGLVYLDNCEIHQFSYPLVSFFFRMKELTGKSYVTAFFSKIREGASRATAYECKYANGTKLEGSAKAEVVLRPLLASFMALRGSLGVAEQAAFDRAWGEHRFDKLIDLDRLYRNETLPGAAQIAVKAKNTIYRDRYRCESPYEFDAVACRVTCEQKF